MTLHDEKNFERYNILAWETDALYHKISLTFGLTDSAVNILYTIYYEGGTAKLADVVRYSGLQKQTVNSSLRKLEEKGLLTLGNYDGKSKVVTLTEKGKALSEKTVRHLIKWEDKALSTFTNEELKLFLSLMEKYLNSMKESLEEYEKTVPPKIE